MMIKNGCRPSFSGVLKGLKNLTTDMISESVTDLRRVELSVGVIREELCGVRCNRD